MIARKMSPAPSPGRPNAAAILTLALLLPALAAVPACSGGGDNTGQTGQTATGEQAAPAISGRIVDGLRVLTIDPAAPGDFTIYRGDYVRLETSDNAPLDIAVPDLGVEKSYPVPAGETAYFKVPDAGSYAYTIGDAGGTITAIAYAASGYQEVSATEAAALITNISPFILDVRTSGEFAAGHVAGASLVPVQVLQQQVASLPAPKDEPVLVYCQTGNRSTVAARILMENGYDQVINLRHGFKEWQQADLPVAK